VRGARVGVGFGTEGCDGAVAVEGCPDAVADLFHHHKGWRVKGCVRGVSVGGSGHSV
jgi:hypothetical protein